MGDSTENNLFSRATLDITYNLLRKADPQLALTVRNILFETPADKNADKPKNQHTDLFNVQLNSLQVRKIVEVLMDVLNEASETHTEDNTSLFRPVLIQSIINEWTVLAKSMFDEYQQSKDS